MRVPGPVMRSTVAAWLPEVVRHAPASAVVSRCGCRHAGRVGGVLSGTDRLAAHPGRRSDEDENHAAVGQAILLTGAFPGTAAEPGARVFAAVAELDRMAERPLWPGFDPRAIPLEVFEGGRTWIAPPAPSRRVPRHPADRVSPSAADAAQLPTFALNNG